MLVAHGHNVLHIGGEGHTGHTVLVTQHLRHLSLLFHIPDAHSWPVPILGVGWGRMKPLLSLNYV